MRLLKFLHKVRSFMSFAPRAMTKNFKPIEIRVTVNGLKLGRR